MAVMVATPALADVSAAQNAGQLATLHGSAAHRLPASSRKMQSVGVENGIAGEGVALSVLAAAAVGFGIYEATKKDGHSSSP